jgi:hypothetical protein
MAYFIELTEKGSEERTWVNLDRVNRFVQTVSGHSTAFFDNGKELDVREPMAEILVQIPKNLRERQDFED